MPSDFYTATGAPTSGSQLQSSTVIAEFAAIQTAMDKLPTLAGNGSEFVKVNAGGTALETVAVTISGSNTGDETTTTIGDLINGATEKTTPVDADTIGISDSAAANILKKVTWANVKATLKTYFDPLYAALAGSVSQAFSVASLEVGHATDTTITRISAGTIAVEGVNLLTTSTGAALAGSISQSFATSSLSTISINGTQVGGIHERTINGDMSVDQRRDGASQTYTAAAAIAYNVDCFYGSCTGANVTGQRVAAGSNPDQFAYQFTGAASVTQILFGQRYKSTRVADMTQQECAFSVKLSNSLLTSATWTAYYANATDNFAAKTQIATGTFTISATPTQYLATFSAGASAPNGIAIEITVGAQTSGTFTITEWSFKLGSVLEVFERIPPILNLLQCRGYCQKTFDQGVAPVQNVGNVNGCLMGFHQNAAVGPAAYWAFNPPMEGTPTTVTTYDPRAADANWNVAGGGTANTSVVGTATRSGVNITASTQNGTNYSYIHATAEYNL